MSEDKNMMTRKLVHICVKGENNKQVEAYCLVERRRKDSKYPVTLRQPDGVGWNQVFDREGIPVMMLIGQKAKIVKLGGFA